MIRSLSVAAERSIVDYLSSALPDTYTAQFFTGQNGDKHFYTGQNNQDKEAPAVIVSATNSNEVYYSSNVYRLRIEVMVKEMAADVAKDDIGVLASLIFNCFFDPNRNENFTNTDYGFAVMQVQPQDISTDTLEDTLINKLSLEFICALSGTASPATT